LTAETLIYLGFGRFTFITTLYGDKFNKRVLNILLFTLHNEVIKLVDTYPGFDFPKDLDMNGFRCDYNEKSKP